MTIHAGLEFKGRLSENEHLIRGMAVASAGFKRVCFLAVFLAAAAALPLGAQGLTKLYLKDGSYQLVKEYKVESDRVRYYSVERSRWEDVPLALVDFDKTREEGQHA